MNEIHVASWAEFKEKAAKLRQEQREKQGGQLLSSISEPCFRGQASADWAVTTTLERAGHPAMSITGYGRIMSLIYPEISAVTSREFKVPTHPEWLDWHRSLGVDGFFPGHRILGYEFMVYLRQHGFPSPLLDWTASEYVAAYFAFADASAEAKKPDDRVAIYAFIEYATGTKVSSFLAPGITGLGQYVKTHPRHFTQQARYTMCCKLDGDVWCFAPHSDVFNADPASITDHQDVLYKFTIPVSERKAVMTELQRVNLTPWGLFNTEESLMKTMAFKTLEGL